LLVRNDLLSVDPAMRGWGNVAANCADMMQMSTPCAPFFTGVMVASRHLLNMAARSILSFLVWYQDHRDEEAVARLAPLVRAGAWNSA
jgi:NADPH-dependent curcumin reductase CurA